MGWKRRWPERKPRPKVRSLSSGEREHILDVFRKGIESSPVLSSLSIRVRALRGRFYLERVWQFPGEESEVEVIGRVTPLEDSEKDLLLEVEKRKGNRYEVVRGTAEKVIHRIASDTKGTFHGLGTLNASLRKAGGSLNRLEVKMLEDLGLSMRVQERNAHFTRRCSISSVFRWTSLPSHASGTYITASLKS
jgi:hypothetical protein